MTKWSTQRTNKLYNNIVPKDVITIHVKNGIIKVNDYEITRSSDNYMVGGKLFHYRRSAVGYAVHKIQGQHFVALNIELLDKEIFRLQQNVNDYRYRLPSNEELYNARLSSDLPRLLRANQRLTVILESVRIE